MTNHEINVNVARNAVERLKSKGRELNAEEERLEATIIETQREKAKLAGLIAKNAEDTSNAERELTRAMEAQKANKK